MVLKMKLAENIQKALDFVADTAKQLIALSAGIITFIVTFLKDSVDQFTNTAKVLGLISLLFYFFSILFGFGVIGTLTGNLDPPFDKNGRKPNPTATTQSRNVLWTSRLQQALFLLALLFSGCFGCNVLYYKKPEKEKRDTTIYRDTLIIPNK